MNLASLFAPYIQSLVLKPIQKAGIWAARQSLGKTTGDKDLAANAPLISALEGSAAASLTQVGATHLANDKFAKQLGITTTEQNLAAAAGAVYANKSALDLSNQTLLVNFLSQNIVRIN